jgi:hypothetical protein
MKQLPDEKTLLELLFLAQEAEQKAKELCDLTAEIDEKWRIRLEPSPLSLSPNSHPHHERIT